MKGTSIFTEYLQELARYSAKIDRCKISHEDFVELQRMEARIINGRNTGYYTEPRYRILYNTVAGLIDDAREAMRINDEAKRISREIDAQRRKERRAAMKEARPA